MGSGYLTDEELELCQTIEQPPSATTNVEHNNSANNDHTNNTIITKTTNNASPNDISMTNASTTNANATTTTTTVAESLHSPSVKEVLIGGDNNPSRR